MISSLSKSLGWLEYSQRWEKILAVGVLMVAAFLLVYNLGLNLRPGRTKAQW
jgi:hypothetical protein